MICTMESTTIFAIDVRYSLLLESERWRQSDVPVEVQALVHRLETGAGLQLPQAAPTIPSSQPPAKYLVIHGTNFAVLG